LLLLERELQMRPRQSVLQLGFSLRVARDRVGALLRANPQLFVATDLDLWVLRGQVETLEPVVPFEIGYRPRPMPPRPWQLEALRAWAACDRRGIVEAVTGAGKTILGVHAVCRAIHEGGRAMVLVPSTDLVRQWKESFERVLPDVPIGNLGSKGGLRRNPLVIATVQSAIRRPELAPPDTEALLVCDEVHHMGATQFGRALDEGFNQRLGLSATFERSDGGHHTVLRPYFGQVVYTLDYKQAKAAGVIAPVSVWLIGVPFTDAETSQYTKMQQNMVEMRQVMVTEWGAPRGGSELMGMLQIWSGQESNWARCRMARNYLKMFNQRRELLAGAQAKIEALGRLAPTIQSASRALVFCQTVESAQESAERLVGHGVDAKPYVGGLNKTARRHLMEGFKQGAPQTMCAPKVLDEGIDVPSADLGVILAASSSERQMIQRMGRVLRPKDDGRHARFLIVYVKGSFEDPNQGAHEGFLEQMLDVAENVYRLDLSDLDGSPLTASWSGLDDVPQLPIGIGQ
jgi:superfamily II DNA or RNA helicase